MEAMMAFNAAEPAGADGKLYDSGFIAVIDTYSLIAGQYEVVGVSMLMSGSTAASTIISTKKGYFSVPAGRIPDDIKLKAVDGTIIPVGMKPGATVDTKDSMMLTGYPALRNGNYTMQVTARNKYGRATRQDSITVKYVRPIVKLDVTSPLVEGFPGAAQVLSLNSPLDNSPIVGPVAGRVVAQGALSGTVSVQGVEIASTEERDVALSVKASGKYNVKGTATGSRSVARIWIDRPDAPDVELSVGNWNPDDGIKILPNRDAYAPTLDQVQINASAAAGSNCSTIFGTAQDGAIAGEYQQPVCAIRFKRLPDGVNQETATRANLRGVLQTDGNQDVEFETGVLWTDPETATTSFYKAKNRSLTLVGIAPKEPDIIFAPVDKLSQLMKSSPGKMLTYTGITTAGRITVTGKYLGMTVSIKIGNAEPKIVSTTNTSVREFISTNIEQIWTNQDVVVESWYNKYPEQKFSKTLTFTAIPKEPVVVLANTEAMSTSDSIVRGNLGVYQGAAVGFVYNNAESGIWSVQLYEEDGKGKRTAIGDPVDPSMPDGSISINIGRQLPGNRTLVAVAKVSEAAAGVGTQQITSSKASLFVKNGSPLTAQITTRTTSGSVPFTPTLTISLPEQSRVSDIGKVEWSKSADGVQFEAVDGASMALRPQIETSGRVWYKAKLTNRHSQMTGETNAVQLQAFGVPKIQISGDTATFVGQTATLTATSDLDADFTWYISRSATDKSPQIVTGVDSITITPQAPADMLVKVVASEKNAPVENLGRNVSTMTLVRATRPGVQRPAIYGPSYVESGKAYDFKAVIAPLFAPSLKTSLKTKGHWVLPDGSTVDGETLTYTIRPNDKSLRYVAWVENIEDATAAADFSLRPWEYVWPEWKVATRVIDNRVPATLRFQVLAKNPRDLQKLGGEKPSFKWQFPQSFKVLEQTAETATVEANDPGEFQISAEVSDTRGNVTQLSSDKIQIAPAPDLVPDLTIQSGDRWNRAPNKLYARVNLLSVPKNDVVDTTTFKLNGNEVSSGRGIASYIDIPTSGSHELVAIVRSVNGKVGMVTKTVELISGDDPVCQIVSTGDGKSSLTLIAKCSVEKGTIAGYKWKVNGADLPTSSYMLSFARKDIDAGITAVSVIATTDKGQQGRANWPQ